MNVPWDLETEVWIFNQQIAETELFFLLIFWVSWGLKLMRRAQDKDIFFVNMNLNFMFVKNLHFIFELLNM